MHGKLSGTYINNPDAVRITVAVVGSGPSGCYVATFLKKELPHAEITVFESMPTPYGLVRYGIAPDHQGAKNLTRQFDRLFTREGVRFAGNVCVGSDVDFADLSRCFDVVVLATGLWQDRSLGICEPGDPRVIGAGTLLRALNGYPVHTLPRADGDECEPLGRRLAVIGMGNVAIDVARLMCKEAEEFVGSDIHDELLDQLRPERPVSIDVISRSSVSQAKFDIAMMRELVSLPSVDVSISGLRDSDAGPAAELLRSHATTEAGAPSSNARTQLRLHFRLTPESVTNDNAGAHVRLKPSGEAAPVTEFVVDTVITAIGFSNGSRDDRSCPNEEWSGKNVYRVGWLSRGSHGAIPENRKDARQVAETIVNDVVTGHIEIGAAGYSGLEASLRDVVTFADWQRIKAFEEQQAPPDRCRRKITDRRCMLAIATPTSHSATLPAATSSSEDPECTSTITES